MSPARGKAAKGWRALEMSGQTSGEADGPSTDLPDTTRRWRGRVEELPIDLGEPEDPLPGPLNTRKDDIVPATVSKMGYDSLKLTYVTPRLNKKNYVDWAAKMEVVLDIQGVWTVVSGEEKQPNEKATTQAIRDWRKRNGIALAI